LAGLRFTDALDRGELPEPSEQAARLATREQEAPLADPDHRGQGEGRGGSADLGGRQARHAILGERDAVAADGAGGTAGRLGAAHGGPQLHERLVEIPGARTFDEGGGERPELLLPRAISRESLNPEEAG